MRGVRTIETISVPVTRRVQKYMQGLCQQSAALTLSNTQRREIWWQDTLSTDTCLL